VIRSLVAAVFARALTGEGEAVLPIGRVRAVAARDGAIGTAVGFRDMLVGLMGRGVVLVGLMGRDMLVGLTARGLVGLTARELNLEEPVGLEPTERAILARVGLIAREVVCGIVAALAAKTAAGIVAPPRRTASATRTSRSVSLGMD